jgi:hypothetical protein
VLLAPGTTVLALTSPNVRLWSKTSMQWVLVATPDGRVGDVALWASDERLPSVQNAVDRAERRERRRKNLP